MFFLNYIEVDYEFAQLSTLSTINVNKLLLIDTYCIDNDKLLVNLSFCFNKLMDVDNTKLYNYIFLLWLITGKLAMVSRFTSELVLGIKYYNILLNLYLDDFLLFKFLDFIINGWLPLLSMNKIKITFGNDRVYMYISDFEIFNNIRLSYNTYIYTIDVKLQIEFIDLNHILKSKLNLFKLI